MKLNYLVAAAATGLVMMSVAAPGLAAKGVEKPPVAVVGTPSAYRLVPDLAKAKQTRNGRYSWRHSILQPGASFLKVHIVNMNLRAGDTLTLSNQKGRVIETLTGLGPKAASTFWALSSPGDSLVIEFQFAKPYDYKPFRIDQVIAGDRDLFAPAVEQGQRSICSPADFEDAICYQGDAGKWSNIEASVGVMSVGGNANSALFCSGSNISAQNYVLTNNHCIANQAECNASEFVFRFYRTGCNDGSPTTADWQSFRCDEVVAFEPFIGCDAGPGDLDFTLSSIIGDAASSFGFVEPDPDPVSSGEDIYIVQHPDGRPHEITHGGGSDFVVDGTVLRYYTTLDTEGGSSGSPLFREADDKLIGLHHCGGCSDPGVGNRGMAMSDIYPLIEQFVCTNNLTLRSAGFENLEEVVGNGNTVVEPGESWRLTPKVTNASCAADAFGVSADFKLSAGSADAVLLVDRVSFGNVAAGQTVAGTPLTFQVLPGAACGNDVTIDLITLSAINGGPYSPVSGYVSQAIGEEVFSTVFFEDFSNGLSNWTVIDGGTGSSPAQTWTDTDPGARGLSLTAPYAIVDSDAHGVGLVMDEELISPVIDATGYSGLSLNFNHDFRWYSGGIVEQPSVDVRSTLTLGEWVSVANYSGANTSGAVSIDITAYAADDLQIRFHYFNAVYEWWWAVDDITVLGSNGFVCSTALDTDGDGTPDDADNCRLDANPDQRDSNGDGYGNLCDADLNNDGFTNFVDLDLFRNLMFTAEADADLDGNGIVNFVDLNRVSQLFFQPPGPSGVAH